MLSFRLFGFLLTALLPMTLLADTYSCEAPFQSLKLETNLALGGFSPITKPQLKSNPQNFMSISNLKANTEYKFSLYMRHPAWNESGGPEGVPYLLSLKVSAMTNSMGVADLKKSLIQDLLDREPSEDETQYTDFMALKFLSDLEKSNVSKQHQEVLDLIESDINSNFLYVFAQDSESKSSIAKYYQEFQNVAPGVRVIDLDPEIVGFVGRLYLPMDYELKDPANLKTLLVFGGSGGSPPYSDAEDIASRGHIGLAVDYFDFVESDLTKKDLISLFLQNVPLEKRFGNAVKYLNSLGVNSKNITLMGESRGGEGALVIAAYLANQLGIEKVIANRPLMYANGERIGWDIQPGQKEGPAWRLNGSPIPFISYPGSKNFDPFLLDIAKKTGTLERVRFKGSTVNRLPIVKGWEAFVPKGDGNIPVENFNGSIYSIAGEQDGLWPAADAVRSLQKRRRSEQNDRHIVVKGAGHFRSGNRSSVFAYSENNFFYPGLGLMIDGGIPRSKVVYDIINQWLIRSVVEGSDLDQLPFPEFVE